MQTFKGYIAEDLPILSWNGSHAEIRNMVSLKETDYNVWYNKPIHDSPDFKPQAITQKHKSAIRSYCHGDTHGSVGASDINAYLRNRAGDKAHTISPFNTATLKGPKNGMFDGRISKVKKAVKHLSAAFIKENTNKRRIIVYGGVPEHVGKKLMEAGEGTRHHIAGFTSTSTEEMTAQEFARIHAENPLNKSKDWHVIEYDLHPHTAISIVHHSAYSENEMLLHHGAHIEYHGTEYTPPRHDGFSPVYTHHVTVYPDSKPLSKYGKYS